MVTTAGCQPVLFIKVFVVRCLLVRQWCGNISATDTLRYKSLLLMLLTFELNFHFFTFFTFFTFLSLLFIFLDKDYNRSKKKLRGDKLKNILPNFSQKLRIFFLLTPNSLRNIFFQNWMSLCRLVLCFSTNGSRSHKTGCH